MHRVADALHRLAINTLTIPPGVDTGDFIVSGGTLTAPSRPAKPRAIPTLAAAVQEYLGSLAHLAESHRYTIGVHLRNLQKKLPHKVDRPIDRVERRDLKGFIQARLKERVERAGTSSVKIPFWLMTGGTVEVSVSGSELTLKDVKANKMFKHKRAK